jgi:hypothetical protein
MKRIKNSRKTIFRNYLIGLAVIIAVAWGVQYMTGAAKGPKSTMAASTPQLRNDLRRENLKLIAGAFHRYAAEVGPLPIKIASAQSAICSGASVNCKKSGKVDLAFLTSAGYLISVPTDPVGGHELYSAGYTIGRNASSQLVLTAPRAEAGASISQTIE